MHEAQKYELENHHNTDRPNHLAKWPFNAENSACILDRHHTKQENAYNARMQYDIQHNPNQQRFETSVEQSLCVIDYELQAATLVLAHVIVPGAVEGRGIAGQLTQAALDWAREKNYRVNPVCPYVQTWLRRHPEYLDLVEA